ncbi:hypothetical protein F4780DRAFT_607879 [Xylariomycetidae sp. FL0641]|nr:hypothetical protein F4780DRAFT_607879 [Xylariomycetidae sp. FL0641]
MRHSRRSGFHRVPSGESFSSSSDDISTISDSSLDVAEPVALVDTSDDESHHPDDPPTPRFMQDEGSWKRWKWVPYRVRRPGKALIHWAQGPEPPKIWTIRPLLPRVQRAPLRLLDILVPKKKYRVLLLLALCAAWILTFSLVLWHGETASDVQGWGQPVDISCGATYWTKNNGCGLDGMDCRPFNGSGFAFRCAANCGDYHVLNPRAVGDQEIVYAPFVIGGPPDPANELDPVYRGDSYICTAAVHAGVVSNTNGGCGVVSLIGQQANFVSTERYGIKSVAFDSYFPLSYTFLSDVQCKAQDVRWTLLAVSVAFTFVLSLFTTSVAAFFFPTFIIAFWQVGMASDPPSHDSTADLFSTVLGNFLPAMFCAWVFYDKMGVYRTLKDLTAQFEKTILWLGACWTGALTNYTFDFIPIQRLTGHDLDQQPGAKAALSIIVIVLAVIVIAQVWCFQQEGRLVRYLKLYALFILAILISLALPGLDLRIHHYIVALLLLPGTSMQTRPALLYQGILVGLFINGIARWGFDPFLQTSAALQNDAQLGTALPQISSPIINTTTSSITFQWESPSEIRYDGISILVNDVERYRGFFSDGDNNSFIWTRDNSTDYNEYFRFGYVEGTTSGDYTKAGIWNTDLEWTEMKPGPSRLRARDRVNDGTLRVPREVWKRQSS